MEDSLGDYLEILQVLVRHGVDFIVVGGVSAVLQGAPLTTMDLDIVHSRKADNLKRLSPALAELDAYFRGRGNQKFRPDMTHLSSPGHQLLMTRFGPLDLLGTIGANQAYEDLLGSSREMQVEEFRIRVLNLATLIRIKEELGFEKDKAMLPVLRNTLKETKNRKIKH